MRGFLAVVVVCLILNVAPVEAQGRLGGSGSGGAGGNQTAEPNQTAESEPWVQPTGFAEDVHIIVTDNVLYGFTRDEIRNKRLGNEFSVYLSPINGTIDYRILLDDLPLTLGNGLPQASAVFSVEEKFSLPNVARVNLVIELIRGEEVEEVDFGLVRLRPMRGIAEEVEDGIEDKLKDQIRQFSPSEWTAHSLKWGFAGLAAVGLGLFAGYHRGKEEEEDAQPFTIAF